MQVNSPCHEPLYAPVIVRGHWYAMCFNGASDRFRVGKYGRVEDARPPLARGVLVELRWYIIA